MSPATVTRGARNRQALARFRHSVACTKDNQGRFSRAMNTTKNALLRLALALPIAPALLPVVWTAAGCGGANDNLPPPPPPPPPPAASASAAPPPSASAAPPPVASVAPPPAPP